MARDDKESPGFLGTLKEIRQGQSLHELSEHLAVLVEAVRATGRKGSLTYTLTIKPASKGETVTLMVEDAVSVKRPNPERGTTVFFATNDNGLQRNDPRQPELLGLRKPAEVAHIREAQ